MAFPLGRSYFILISGTIEIPTDLLRFHRWNRVDFHFHMRFSRILLMRAAMRLRQPGHKQHNPARIHATAKKPQPARFHQYWKNKISNQKLMPRAEAPPRLVDQSITCPSPFRPFRLVKPAQHSSPKFPFRQDRRRIPSEGFIFDASSQEPAGLTASHL